MTPSVNNDNGKGDSLSHHSIMTDFAFMTIYTVQVQENLYLLLSTTDLNAPTILRKRIYRKPGRSVNE